MPDVTDLLPDHEMSPSGLPFGGCLSVAFLTPAHEMPEEGEHEPRTSGGQAVIVCWGPFFAAHPVHAVLFSISRYLQKIFFPPSRCLPPFTMHQSFFSSVTLLVLGRGNLLPN